MSLKDMTRDELLALKQESFSVARMLQDEMRALNVMLGIRTVEMKKQEREAAAGNPDAVSTKVLGVTAKASSRAPKPDEGKVP